MTWAEFKRKWSRYQGKESSAYQEHFNDLCRMLGQPTPAEADPSGSDFFCFQKRVVKDAELLGLPDSPDASEPSERGFADVWKKDCFGWEYKGKKKSLDEAYKQLLRYREALLNPPLLVVCDFDRYVIRTNFNGTVQETHEFTNDQIDRPENLRILRALFEDPDFLKPQRTTAQVTEKVAEQMAAVARSLQGRESVELEDARTRKEVSVAQRKNLRIARFLNRITFCLFAEDTGLLPKDLFTDILKASLHNPEHFAAATESLFRTMAKGGLYGAQRIRHFNGHLFEESSVFELTEDELKKLADAGEADWQFIQPSIMGTLFQRALDERQRAALGAQYTGEPDIRDLVEPVLMAPLRREWAALKASLLPSLKQGKGTPEDRARIAAFLKKLRAIIVMNPACGSGNFLYVSLQMLLGLEKEVINFAAQLGFRFDLEVSVQQLRAIEINPYAFELAQVSVQIGFLQWRRDNGFDNDRSPVLQNLDGFQNEDALLVPHFHSKAKTLKEAQAGEHTGDDALKFYTERDWPKCDVIVSNPPFLGGKRIRSELGDSYVDALFGNYGQRVPPEADLCCYWFEKARSQIENRKCQRAGLLATNSIRQQQSRPVLQRIKETGDIFFAESDREWVLEGANVRVSMVGFDRREQRERVLDGKAVPIINVNLTSQADITQARKLRANENIAYMGDTKGGSFDIEETLAIEFFNQPNAHGIPNSQVVIPWLNGTDITGRARRMWIVDFGVGMGEGIAVRFEAPFKYVREHVKPDRDHNKREVYRRLWWQHVEARPGMRAALSDLGRFLATVIVAKHRLFVWIDPIYLPDHRLFVFARNKDDFFGILHSQFHEVWSLRMGSTLEDRPSYSGSTCFETFPFPRPTPAQEAAIATAAKELNELRERWLNPPEWTETRMLEFPGTVSGPWSRYVDPKTVDAKTGVGTVRYPRLEPRDADCAAKLKKRTLTNLYNERPAWLDLAHKKLAAAVAAAYGWPADLSDEMILEKLLALNLERAAEEAKAAKVKKPKTQRAKEAGEMI